jgi:rhodanese-related sulfurtransferase
MIDGDESFELINVLPESEFRREHIPGSINLPVDDESFARRVEERVGGDKDRKIVVYCAYEQCQASATAAQTLELAGLTNVSRYELGTLGWKTAGHSMEGGYVRA